MSESYPHFEFESHNDKGEKSPKRDRPTGKIERPIGRMATPFEHRIPLKPLGELYPKQEKPAELQKPLPSASEFHVSAELPNWRRPEPSELASMAEQAHRARLEAEVHEQAGRETTDTGAKVKPTSETKAAETSDSREGSPEAAEDGLDRPTRQVNDASLFHSSELPREISSEWLTGDDTQERERLGPEVEQNPNLPSDNEANFQSIVNQPELTDLISKQIPVLPRLSVEEQAQPAAFDEWVRRDHPELATSDMAAASDSGEDFNDIVRHNFGDGVPVGPTRYHEQAPGEPPIDAGHGGANMPPNPPTAEGGAWGSPSAWEQPAGGMAGPAALAGVSALEARRHLDNLRHTAAELTLAGGEAALAGAIGILGLALAAEHVRAKHREKKLSRQLDKQNQELNRTNQSLATEQAKHLQTRDQLDRLSADQARQQHIVERVLPAAEIAAGAGLIGTTAASVEHAAKSGDHIESPRQISDQELAHRLKNSRELGRAIERNPEMRKNAEDQSHDLRELVGASAYADTLKRERNYEHLQTEPVDNAGQSHASGGTDVVGTNHPLGLPQPGNPVLPSPQAVGNTVSQYQNQDSKSKVVKPIAAATVLVVVVLILIFIFS